MVSPTSRPQGRTRRLRSPLHLGKKILVRPRKNKIFKLLLFLLLIQFYVLETTKKRKPTNQPSNAIHLQYLPTYQRYSPAISRCIQWLHCVNSFKKAAAVQEPPPVGYKQFNSYLQNILNLSEVNFDSIAEDLTWSGTDVV